MKNIQKVGKRSPNKKCENQKGKNNRRKIKKGQQKERQKSKIKKKSEEENRFREGSLEPYRTGGKKDLEWADTTEDGAYREGMQ